MPQAWRDSILFVSGLAGVAYETVARNADRPYLLIVFAGMMGLPAFLWKDEGRLSSFLDRRGTSTPSSQGGKESERS